MASYRLSLAAQEDVWRIYHYGTAQFGIARADHYFDELYDCFERITRQPEAYAICDIKQGYRRCQCGSDSIYYRVLADTVLIVRILGQQDANRLLD